MRKKKVGTATRSHFGMNWNNGVHCGSRSANSNNSALNLNSNNAGQGVAETKGLTLRLAVSTWLKSRTHCGGLLGPVVTANVQGGIF